jgi:hypothetical protein
MSTFQFIIAIGIIEIVLICLLNSFAHFPPLEHIYICIPLAILSLKQEIPLGGGTNTNNKTHAIMLLIVTTPIHIMSGSIREHY